LQVFFSIFRSIQKDVWKRWARRLQGILRFEIAYLVELAVFMVVPLAHCE
jgi:hypothetical protein